MRKALETNGEGKVLVIDGGGSVPVSYTHLDVYKRQANNFVTITKKAEYDWFEITPELKEAVKKFIASGVKPVDDALLPTDLLAEGSQPVTLTDVESKIKDLLEKYVKPAIQMDGGHIEFRSFEDGVVKLALQGSCSGCPSSTLTLKSGIEGLLKRMVPEVVAVESIAE